VGELESALKHERAQCEALQRDLAAAVAERDGLRQEGAALTTRVAEISHAMEARMQVR